MTLKSMTGFARSDGAHAGFRWHWEVRSVNGRGLDIRLRLPPGFEALNSKAREAMAARFQRGNINIALVVQREWEATEIRINEAALAQVIRAANRVRESLGGDLPRAEGLLALKGVLEVTEPEDDEAATAALHAAMLASLTEALDAAVEARSAEGARLTAVLSTQIDEIARLVSEVERSPARRPEVIKSRLAELVARLMDTGASFDAARLHQEAILIATRVDIEEELARLKAHIEAARDLLAANVAAGRKFDFLTQEFNREANTLTAKANDTDVARAGLSLKVVIDQIREQVQNIE